MECKNISAFESISKQQGKQKDTFEKRKLFMGGPGSSVGIATGYGLEDPGIEFWWGRDFPHLSGPALGPTQPPVQWIPGLFWGRKRPERDADPLSSAEV
jgi:hypothetical protein